jgi:hypothetical protein
VNQAGKERVAPQAARRSRHQTTVCRSDGGSTSLVQSSEASKPRSATCVGRPTSATNRALRDCRDRIELSVFQYLAKILKSVALQHIQARSTPTCSALRTGGQFPARCFVVGCRPAFSMG